MTHQTLYGKIMSGYQGWFNTPADNTGMGWRHYTPKGIGEPIPGNLKFDIWPDTAECDEDEICRTALQYPDGTPAGLPSSCNRKTVRRHFRWMSDYGLDGVFLQRFYQYCAQPEQHACMEQVLANCREAAREHNRSYGMMYDLTNMPGDDTGVLIDDWKRLSGDLGLTADPTYIHHHGKPVVVVWGLGFNDKPGYTWADCMPFVRFLKDWGATVMLGIPTGWREQPQAHWMDTADPAKSIIRWADCTQDFGLLEALETADILSPWTPGRVETPEAVRLLAEQIWVDDLAWCNERNLEYMPVVYPGFSWHNSRPDMPLNQVSRLKGAFLKTFYDCALETGVSMIYQAMFDEVDEATAIFKCASHPPGNPGQFVDLEGLPSDAYLKIVGEASRKLKTQVRIPGISENL